MGSVDERMKKELELYIHIPFCMKKCEYCDFLSFRADEHTQRAYVEALLREIAYYGEKCREYDVASIYIGGGTPSWLDEELMSRIMSALRSHFSLSPEAEISIECNPGTVTDGKFAAYRRAGINRISIGLQSADERELRLLGRIHTYGQFLKTYELARRNGFTNINIDLMNSLPGQTAESFSHTLRQVIRLKPEHISVYSLIIEEGTPFYARYQEDAKRQSAGEPTAALPTEEEVLRTTRLTEELLSDAGYEQYEISNFAKPGYACRHNIGYWQRANYLGLGIGAASLMENIRYTNASDLYKYLEKTVHIKEELRQTAAPGSGDAADQAACRQSAQVIPATNLHETAERIPRKAQMEEFMFLGLRMTDGVSRERFAQNFGTEIEAVYQDVMQSLKQEGLLAKRAGQIFLTKRGQEVSNYVLAQFLLM